MANNLAKVLGVKLQKPEPTRDDIVNGEQVYPIQTLEQYLEQEPRTSEFLLHYVPSGRDIGNYFLSLFPFLNWIGKYNLQWLIGDLVAGITIGAVVVPQGMAYAILAGLPAQFGLYSSFMGVLLYWFFATSKDITIGPVAVMSQLTASILADLAVSYPNIQGYVFASALAILAGAIILFIGLIRFGWIVDLISLIALAAYMTGSALNIAVSQVPALMGILVNSRDPTYLVVINTFRNINHTKIDAAMGLTALFLLYLIRWVCNRAAVRWPQHKRLIFFITTLRTVFVILLYTLISWVVNMWHNTKPTFKILGTVPRGFQYAEVPTLNKEIAGALVSYLPATVIVLLIEHIAISKSFGRVNNYTINPSQEMVAIGVTNVLGPFLGAYPSTGSFSRTAIKSKAGVRTPLAGVITAIVVLLAIYALPAVFFYIPSASLSAVIIHAVGDLITPPNTVYQFWRVSPFEVVIFFVGVFVTVFTSIENGIYCTISISAAMLLYRILKAKGRFVGRVKVHSLVGDQLVGDESSKPVGDYGKFDLGGVSEAPTRNVFLPLSHEDGSNPNVAVTNPYPGIFIYRFQEGFTYPNATHSLEYLTEFIFKETRRTNLQQYDRPGDRPWNNPGPSWLERKRAAANGIDVATIGEDPNLPTLKAIILDCSSVNNVDVTSVQTLIDVRNQLDRYASPDVVDWHFANLQSRWAKRALVSAGFGYPSERPDGLHQRWKPVFNLTEILYPSSNGPLSGTNDTNGTEKTPVKEEARGAGSNDIEAASSHESDNPKLATEHHSSSGSRQALVHGLSRPLFHIDLTSALQSAILNVQARGSGAEAKGPGAPEVVTA